MVLTSGLWMLKRDWAIDEEEMGRDRLRGTLRGRGVVSSLMRVGRPYIGANFTPDFINIIIVVHRT